MLPIWTKTLPLIITATTIAACSMSVDTTNDLSDDSDGDGYTGFEGDCDDDDEFTHPGAAELESDSACMTDQDEDGWGAVSPVDGVDGGTDCDDSSASLNLDDADEDGNSSCDGDCDDNDALIHHLDEDGDGYSICDGDCDDADDTLELNDADGDGHSTCDGDCYDNDSSIVPVDEDGDGYTVCDEDCDDNDASMNFDDADGDGMSSCDGDCDDSDATLNFNDDDGDGFYSSDDDCDDSDELAFPGSAENESDSACMKDADDDGWGDDNPSANITNGQDCDDNDDFVFPGAAEDESTTQCMKDTDDDGWGDDNPGGDITEGTDCDDDDSGLNGADNDTDGYSTCDDDCDDDDGSMNPGDADGDGYSSCEDDCDDDDENINPDATDGLLDDRDCDGVLSSNELSNADYTFIGEANTDYAGYSVASAGDVDADGLNDLLVGAYQANDGGTSKAGKAYVILGASLGATTTINLSLADYILTGTGTGRTAGYSVASAGDVDGDGRDDILVGEPGNAGNAYIVLGSSLGATKTISLSNADFSFEGEDNNDEAGSSVASAGDVDGDGKDDILVGAPSADAFGKNGAGKAYLILGDSLSGSPNKQLSNADYTFVGNDPSDSAGSSVASAGDIDGDGNDDILVGAYQAGSRGLAYVILGSSFLGGNSEITEDDADYKLIGENSSDDAGWSVASAGDVDGDGLSDVLVGALNGGTGGKAYLVLGSSLVASASSTFGLGSADYSFDGENSSDQAGSSVASAGDVDGDGKDDILVGAMANGDGGPNAGKTYLILAASLGSTSNLSLSSADYSFVGEDPDDRSGSSIAGVGDMDGNGTNDLFIGAYNAGGGSEGKAYLILSGTSIPDGSGSGGGDTGGDSGM